jgi:hypothetical protein
MSEAVCVACSHKIDAAARVCPYCGANPQTGEKIDTEALLRETFQPRAEQSRAEGVLEFARQRQGIVVLVGVVVAFLILAALHQFVTARNANAVASGPAVPLTDITDLSNQAVQVQPQPMPKLDFQYDGNSKTMRTFIVESGAVAPPEVIAAQQAAARQAALIPVPAGENRRGPSGSQPARRRGARGWREAP